MIKKKRNSTKETETETETEIWLFSLAVMSFAQTFNEQECVNSFQGVHPNVHRKDECPSEHASRTCSTKEKKVSRNHP